MNVDRQVVACNYREATKIASKGALAYVQTWYLGGNLPDRLSIVVRSRGGRWVVKWEATRRLGNFRLKTLPPEHPRYHDNRVSDGTQAQLSELLAAQTADQALRS